jgi:hypothetical protein
MHALSSVVGENYENFDASAATEIGLELVV